MDEFSGCPCNHLDEPCDPNCTCLNPYSSKGCDFCCSYGSKEQQKLHAEYIKSLIQK